MTFEEIHNFGLSKLDTLLKIIILKETVASAADVAKRTVTCLKKEKK